MKQITVDGNEACALASYMFTEIAGIYPITPSSPMPEAIDRWSNSGKKNIFKMPVKVVEMQSEAGAIGMVHGSLQTGSLTSTYTASQGLLLMIPNMYKIAGEMLPCTMHVAARSLATHALSIFGDHQDIYAARATGFCMLASSSVQDAHYLTIVSHLSAIKSSLPFMHFFDGFRTSHEKNKITVFEDNDYDNLIDEDALKKFRTKALNIDNPVTRGTNQNGDIYFQNTEARNKYYDMAIDNVVYYMNKINEKTKMNYKPFNYYGSKDATKVIVAMGSVCETIKDTIDYLKGKIGLIEVHLYRPFSAKHLLMELPKTVTTIAVLDRTKEAGSSGEPLYLDIKNVVPKDITVVGGRYGLSSKDTTPGMIKAVYDMLDNPKNNFTIGIVDDVTNLSLNYEELNISSLEEFLIYGFGSDGMVSASKSIIEMIGNNTNKYVQEYSEYDSKKSGGVTIGHLRFDNKPIRQTYFVQSPSLIVISKDTYLEEFDPISKINKNGIIIINTTKEEKEFQDYLSPYKQLLKDRNAKVYMINAYALARKCNLGNKISMIMESAILYLTNLIDYDSALKHMKEFIKNKFGKKSEEIVKNNILGIKEAPLYLKEVTLDNNYKELSFKEENIYDVIKHREGNKLKVSDFKKQIDGTFEHTKDKNNQISDLIPVYNPENCIQCSMCSAICPHGVIRPFLLTEEEYAKANNSIKEKCIKAIGSDYYFVIGISKENCTGCGVCVNICPGKAGVKALSFEKAVIDDDFDYLVNNIKDKHMPKNTMKNIQFTMPKFAFHGACAGCGETAYIKLLTQLFGDNLIIANATGCSSIYGASIPNIPYSLPWANSLFEDNAEYGYGMLISYENNRKKIIEYMNNNKCELFNKYLNNNSYDIQKEVYDNIDYVKHPLLNDLKNYIIKPSIWCIGGDGWAFDIGFSGIDHVLSSGDNINILVLDSQVYSNTGGQSSKATPKGAVAQFASSGKQNAMKDLARIAMSYPNVYVAQISLGANMMQAVNAFKEAEEHNGPSIIIAYTPCISHGIKGGMKESVNIEKLAALSGYFPIFRYNGKLHLDINPNFDLYEEFLNSQTRYSMLKAVNEEKALELLKANKENAIKRFEFYKKLSEES